MSGMYKNGLWKTSIERNSDDKNGRADRKALLETQKLAFQFVCNATWKMWINFGTHFIDRAFIVRFNKNRIPTKEWCNAIYLAGEILDRIQFT